MAGLALHRASARTILALSLFALALVVIGYLTMPYRSPAPHDEGALAHLFQLSIVLLLPTGVLFLTTADWSRPQRIVTELAAPAIFVVLAFAALYYLEHYYLLPPR